MREINCNVIQDILPLYVDDVVCQDTRSIVEAHLETCENCRTEVAAMRSRVVVPVDTDQAGSITKVKRRWGKKQLTKGVALTLAVMILLTGAFLFAYGYGVPVKFEDVTIRTGFQCNPDSPYETDFPTQDQTWIFDLTVKGGDVRTSSEWEHMVDPNGDPVYNGMVIHVRRSLITMPWDHAAGSLRGGYGSEDAPEDMPEGCDFTITFVFADKTVTYSMKEEGLYEPAQPHSAEFCPLCTK